MSSLINDDLKVLKLSKAPVHLNSLSNDADDTKSRIGDEYVLVRKGLSTKVDVSDTKQNVVAPKVRPDLMGAKRILSRSRNGLKGRVIKAKLYTQGIYSIAANTALALSTGLGPSGAAEFGSFQTLFDEIRVDKIEIDYCTVTGFAGTYNPTNGSMMAIGYDSTYNTIPGSVADVLESDQHQLTSVLGPGVSNNILSPTSTTATGLKKFVITVPKGPVANTNPVTGGSGLIPNFPGEWMAIGDASDTVGYRRVYYPAQGAANAVVFQEMVTFHCSFRERT